ncbi:hypothetical protein FA15DRAFT_638117 [Coprinopsis marcescibilis]|uniref:PQ-loop-domain-containing protein n=1 Tax=Coprinopsis marcescibilis TaxID=230819 RepID=A0A5C3KZY8_COPMA|nr:hypothetical protein FA15DRAFT_638117 [Coprinopsis marcescibilis]
MPQPNVIVENVFGILGQIIPQIWKSWRQKSTVGLSDMLMLLWAISGIFQGTYTVVRWINIPLIVQPQLFSLLAYISWGQQTVSILFSRRSKKVAVLMTLGVVVASGVVELILIMVTRPLKEHSKNVATTVYGVISSILLAVALFPQYWEIYKLKAVIGISLVFISIDILGGVFNDLSLVFKEEFDVVASIQYSVVVVSQPFHVSFIMGT